MTLWIWLGDIHEAELGLLIRFHRTLGDYQAVGKGGTRRSISRCLHKLSPKGGFLERWITIQVTKAYRYTINYVYWLIWFKGIFILQLYILLFNSITIYFLYGLNVNCMLIAYPWWVIFDYIIQGSLIIIFAKTWKPCV